MSKHPKRSRHRIPDCALQLRSDPIDERYQTEVDMSVNRLEARYRKAAKALAAAEAKAERVRQQIDRLADQQAEAARIAAHRAQEQARLLEYIENIRVAAQQSRVATTRAELDRKHREAIAKRNAATAQRKAEAKAVRRREQQITLARRQHAQLECLVEDRRRELHEIELLMQPEGYGPRRPPPPHPARSRCHHYPAGRDDRRAPERAERPGLSGDGDHERPSTRQWKSPGPPRDRGIPQHSRHRQANRS